MGFCVSQFHLRISIGNILGNNLVRTIIIINAMISTRCCTLKTYLGTITLVCVASKVTEPEKCCPPSVPFNCLVNFEVSECVHPRAGAARIQFGENDSVSHWLVRAPGLSLDCEYTANPSQIAYSFCFTFPLSVNGQASHPTFYLEGFKSRFDLCSFFCTESKSSTN